MQFWFRDEDSARHSADDRNGEIVSLGTEAALPVDLRVMAVRCFERLSAVGKTLDDATEFFLNSLTPAISIAELCRQVNAFYLDRATNQPKRMHYRRITKVTSELTKRLGERKATSVRDRELRNWIEGFELSPVTKNSTEQV